ncbi:hypothetical protein D9758_017767 [Tetrapyrgos nigripes]|uniref:Uncharacterized protein n=1 Tax=Tetrapyrgos nigripes TaxID=182062 RepID=A0A8H5C5T2_9AGAR|nr:hypothetical protein D9758_017767 [Tetrapyrgos nigripes]
MRGITIHPDIFNGMYRDAESLWGWDFVLRMWGDNILLVTVVLANGAIAEISEISGIHSSSPSLALTTSLRFHTHPIPLSGRMFAQFVRDVPTSIATQTMEAYKQFALSPNLANGVLKRASQRGRVRLLLSTTYFAMTPGLSEEEVEARFHETLKGFLDVTGLPEPGTGTTLVTGSYINMLGAGAVLTNGGSEYA